jgi:hypothetical protein
MQKIIILDLALGESFVYDYNPDIYNDGYEWFAQDNCTHHESNCSWMIVDEFILTRKDTQN